MSQEKQKSSIFHLAIFSFFILFAVLVLNMNATDFWSVMCLKWHPIRQCFHFLIASTMAYASFSTAECCCSDQHKVLERKATEQPDFFNEAAMAQSDASVSITKRTAGSMATISKLAISFLRFLKASIAADNR